MAYNLHRPPVTSPCPTDTGASSLAPGHVQAAANISTGEDSPASGGVGGGGGLLQSLKDKFMGGLEGSTGEAYPQGDTQGLAGGGMEWDGFSAYVLQCMLSLPLLLVFPVLAGLPVMNWLPTNAAVQAYTRLAMSAGRPGMHDTG
jgi:hypothetical protein